MKKTKIILIILCIILVGVLLATSIFLIRNHNEADDNNKIIVKDNVNIITTKDELQPLDVTDDSIIFNYDPGYEVGDIVVAGIIDAAPNGFIRRITDVSIESEDYCYATEYAVLTEVFEEAHIIKTFAVTDEEVRDVEEIDNNVMSLNLSSTADDAIVQSLVYAENKNVNVIQTSETKIKPSENGLGVVVELSENVGENLEISGQVEVNTYFELKIDIEDGEIEFGMAIHTDTSGELFVGIQEELFNKDDKDNFNGEYEKEIISKALPNIQFAIGPVPVVITNDFELSAEISAQLEGQIGTTVGVDAQRVSGFEYSSKTNEVKEINEKEYLSDGMGWKTEASASGSLEAGIYAHLVTKLYGSSGTDLAVGIAGDLSGKLAAGIDDKFEPIVYGKLSLSIGPKASGKIVVTTPVIDYELLETEILKVTLPAFWEKEWETPGPTEDNSETGNTVISYTTYKTKFADANHLTAPSFEFVYPSDWKVTKDEVAVNNPSHPIEEWVEIESDKVIITYMSTTSELGGNGRNWIEGDAIEVAESSFVPGYVQATDYSFLGEFVVAKIHETNYTQLDTNYQADLDNYRYAVIPKTELGTIGYAGVKDGLSFNYGGRTHQYLFMIDYDNEKCSQEDIAEIIQILQSFKLSTQ